MLRAAPAIGLNKLTASEIARATIAGETTCEDVVKNCLARIDARENEIHAWATVDTEFALRQARELDRRATRAPLHGVPSGVKDITATADQTHQSGSPDVRGQG